MTSEVVPLSERARGTLRSLQERHPGGVLLPSAFCCEGQHGEVKGWVLDVPGNASAASLPVGSSLGDGVGCFELHLTGQQVLEHLCDAPKLQSSLEQVVQVLCEQDDAKEARASWWRCSPKVGCGVRALQCATRGADGQVRLVRSPVAEVPVVDSEHWVPELSSNGFVGLYHHWDPCARRLRLYLVVSGYLQKACLEFTDMVQELGASCTADVVAQSQELYWLRNACRRNRARLAHLICAAMRLPVRAMYDHHAADRRGTMLALATTDTLYMDLQSVPGTNMVRVLNHCASTKDMCNGSLCAMAPWEGLWIFHGQNAAPARASTRFGQPYGDFFLPTHAPKLRPDALPRHSPYVLTLASRQARRAPAEAQPKLMPRSDESGLAFAKRCGERRRAQRSSLLSAVLRPEVQEKNDHYLLFNESVLEFMAKRGWSRALGYTALHPLAFCEASACGP